jgi:hypothetical protein
MKKAILRGLLVLVLLARVLGGFPAAEPVQAGGGGAWASMPPRMDGSATGADWGNAGVVSYTHFQVRYKNDSQFLYILLDVTGETPAANPAISAAEFFQVMFDTDQNDVEDVRYELSYTSPNPLTRYASPNGTTWTKTVPCQSYAAVGFGASLNLATPHRVYVTAIRLSEMPVVVGHPLKFIVRIHSETSSFTDVQTGLNSMGMPSPKAAFIYSTPTGLTDAQTFQTQLFQTVGLSVDLVSLGQAELIDYSPYRAIIVGNDTGSGLSDGAWFGTAAAVAKIRQSGKPVVGIGFGGADLFQALGLFLNQGNSMGDSGTSIASYASEHPAWNTPASFPVGTTVSLYTSIVNITYIYTGNPDFPQNSITLLGGDPTPVDQKYFSILGQSAFGTYYTLWGFHSQPNLLSTPGAKLFANLVWQPMCRPAVLYLGGDDTTLRAEANSLLTAGGFPFADALVTDAASLNYKSFGAVLIGWDTTSHWDGNGVYAVKDSHVPVVGMGHGAVMFFASMQLPMMMSYNDPITKQNQAALANPLMGVLQRPSPVAVPSTLNTALDLTPGGVYSYTPLAQTGLGSKSVIGTWADNPANQTIATQILKSTCYQFYGYDSYPGMMTSAARDLLRNMLAEPACSYPVLLPAIRR